MPINISGTSPLNSLVSSLGAFWGGRREQAHANAAARYNTAVQKANLVGQAATQGYQQSFNLVGNLFQAKQQQDFALARMKQSQLDRIGIENLSHENSMTLNGQQARNNLNLHALDTSGMTLDQMETEYTSNPQLQTQMSFPQYQQQKMQQFEQQKFMANLAQNGLELVPPENVSTQLRQLEIDEQGIKQNVRDGNMAVQDASPVLARISQERQGLLQERVIRPVKEIPWNQWLKANSETLPDGRVAANNGKGGVTFSNPPKDDPQREPEFDPSKPPVLIPGNPESELQVKIWKANKEFLESVYPPDKYEGVPTPDGKVLKYKKEDSQEALTDPAQNMKLRLDVRKFLTKKEERTTSSIGGLKKVEMVDVEPSDNEVTEYIQKNYGQPQQQQGGQIQTRILRDGREVKVRPMGNGYYELVQ